MDGSFRGLWGVKPAFWFCRTGPFEVYGGLEESMEFLEPEGGPMEESGDETVTDEETDLGTDWETVPSPRFCDIPSQVRLRPFLDLF